MKNTDEMMRDLFSRRERYIAQKQKKRKIALRVTAIAFPVCMVGLIALFILKSGFFASMPEDVNPGAVNQQGKNGYGLSAGEGNTIRSYDSAENRDSTEKTEPTDPERPRGTTPEETLYPLPSQALFDRIAEDELKRADDEKLKGCKVKEYFGTYGRAVIVIFKYDPGIMSYEAVDQIRVDDATVYDNGYQIRVWKDGRIYSLRQAYDDGNGILTKEDMKMLARIQEEKKQVRFD